MCQHVVHVTCGIRARTTALHAGRSMITVADGVANGDIEGDDISSGEVQADGDVATNEVLMGTRCGLCRTKSVGYDTADTPYYSFEELREMALFRDQEYRAPSLRRRTETIKEYIEETRASYDDMLSMFEGTYTTHIPVSEGGTRPACGCVMQ